MGIKIWKACWVLCNVVLLILIFSALGVFNFVNNNGFCIWGFSCEDSFVNEDYQVIEISFLDYAKYESRPEGIVVNKVLYYESFFETLEKVIYVSKDEYSTIIDQIVNEGSFEEIYNGSFRVFYNNYSCKIDNQFERDYIQNIGELVSNNYHGDCDDYALWLYLIAKEKGLKVRYVIGFSEDSGHAWIQIKIDDEWIEYDTTTIQKGKDIVSKEYLRMYYYD